MSARWQEILAGNGEMEKKRPYNFCDRWCERCAPETRLGCKIHHMEVGMQMTAFSRGKEVGDLEAGDFDLAAEREGEEADGAPWDDAGGDEIDPEAFEGVAFAKTFRPAGFVRTSPLPEIAKAYRERAHAFLEAVLSGAKEVYTPRIQYDLDTVAWYHTLLCVKVERGLAGFHEPDCEDDPALSDAVGQLEICRKAARESLKALRNLREGLPAHRALVPGLLALLHQLQDNIQILEESLE